MPSWDYQAEVAADTPWLWYRLNETVGTTATDSGSSGQDGTYAGTAAERLLDQDPIIWGANPGPQGRCILLNSDGGAVDDARIELAGVSGFPTTELAFECWVEDPGTSDDYLVSYAVAGQPHEFAVIIDSGGNFDAIVQGDSTSLSMENPVDSLGDGRVHHIYIDWRSSDGRVRLFYDGIQHVERTGVATGVSLTDGGTLMFGQDQTGVGVLGATSNAFEGRLDQVAIYDSLLSDERIAIHASAGIVRYVPYQTYDISNVEYFVTSAGGVTIVNRVYDTVAGGFVRWRTSEEDSAGASYPGPGTFGVDTSDYCIEARIAG